MTSADILIIGAGPAGIAAAVSASTSGRKVMVLDDNLAEGGQIWRGGPRRPVNSEARSWFHRFANSGAELLRGHRAVDCSRRDRILYVETSHAAASLQYKQLILATGARELFIPFPGWTLPNVMGVGGLQALAKAGLDIEGKRVVVGGSGPLLLAVAAYLAEHGAIVSAILEQAPWSRLMRFSAGLVAHPAKLWQAMALKTALASVPYLAGAWITQANGDGRVRSVRIHQSSGARDIACDYLAVAYGLIPNIELASLLGCELRDGSVTVDEFQRSTCPEIFCAGESTGIGGVELSLLEGEIAGYAAAGREDRARKLFPARARALRFAEKLNSAFAPREELRSLPDGETFICRCEDVPLRKLRERRSWRDAKLHTRCGMGPCQGRVCGPATQFLFDWTPESTRPPLFPARISTLITELEKTSR